MKEWFKKGDPWIWLNAGALAIGLTMVIGLFILIAVRGSGHFWPSDLVETYVAEKNGKEKRVVGEVVKSEMATAVVMREAGYDIDKDAALVRRYLIKQGNKDITGRDFMWYLEERMGEWNYPKDAVVLERREWGNFYGYPLKLLEDGVTVAEGEAVWPELAARVQRSNQLFKKIRKIERSDIGDINRRQEALRLEQKKLEMDKNISADERKIKEQNLASQMEDMNRSFIAHQKKLDQIRKDLKRDLLIAEVMDGSTVRIALEKVVRFARPNEMGVTAKAGYYLERLWEYLTAAPREANTEGGVFPAIFGTVIMVLLMSILVTPFGILAAIYLHEYARQGPILSLIRVSVYNLAGVPSIVFGVFGLGFFVYFLGGNIDQLFFPERLPAPTFGTPGLFWASLTLALLTLPAVIVATEEGLARIPVTTRQGSLALGATKAETLWRVILPLSAPAMMTGLILAIARAAGEVAPLMLVGVVKMAPSLPVDGYFPYLHLESKIMHLGFHIYDVGFQSPNVEAARPLVYATSLTLIVIIVVLNLAATSIRNRLREKYKSAGD